MSDSCKPLSAIIGAGSSLRKLDLRWNKIDDAGGEALLHALEKIGPGVI